jgi:hypothetical protein
MCAVILYLRDLKHAFPLFSPILLVRLASGEKAYFEVRAGKPLLDD